jgi:hypothetical protein
MERRSGKRLGAKLRIGGFLFEVRDLNTESSKFCREKTLMHWHGGGDSPSSPPVMT